MQNQNIFPLATCNHAKAKHSSNDYRKEMALMLSFCIDFGFLPIDSDFVLSFPLSHGFLCHFSHIYIWHGGHVKWKETSLHVNNPWESEKSKMKNSAKLILGSWVDHCLRECIPLLWYRRIQVIGWEMILQVYGWGIGIKIQLIGAYWAGLLSPAKSNSLCKLSLNHSSNCIYKFLVHWVNEIF